MNQILSLSMRPQRLSELVGQKSLVDTLRNQMGSRPPQAFLFHGVPGTGKTTVARIVAVALQCTHQKAWGEPCNVCLEANGFSKSTHEINIAEQNGVEEIFNIVKLSRYQPVAPATKRVIIMDEFQRASAQAQQLLLKPMEEPPETTVWIICTTDPQKVSAAIRRRCAAGTYQLKGLGPNGTAILLNKAAKQEKITRPLEDLIEQASIHQVTSPALLLSALEKYGAGATAEESIANTDGVSVNTLAICKAVTNGDSAQLRKLLQEVTADEARWVRASVGGWLRSGFWRERDGKRMKAIAQSMLDISDGRAPFDDSQLLLWTIATLYNITRRFAVGAAE
jgi:DNA polymerase-3 subunit gamma/tau